MEEEITCVECGWVGFVADLLCHPDDDAEDKPVKDCRFNVCPDCGSVDSTEDLG